MGTLFVTPQKVYERMQISDDLEGVETAVKSALQGAQEHVQAVMPADLQIRTWDLYFFLDLDAYSGIQPGNRFILELPSFFIRQDMALVVEVSDTWGGTVTAIPVGQRFVNFEKGQLLIDNSYGDKYVHVTCTTGFLEDAVLVAEDIPNGITEERGIEPIPDWLTEAILSYVAVVFDSSQTTNRSRDASETYKKAGDHAMAVLSPHLRKKGFAFRALNA
jgi:hypothetical protein